jgi:hypothetical protein
LRERVTQLEGILATFKEEYNPNFNDEGVKRAVKSWEDYAANKEEVAEEALERDVEQVSKPDSETEGINWAEWETVEEETDTEARKYSKWSLKLQANKPKSTDSKNTSPQPSAPGCTKNYPTSASCSSRMAS